jgi:hypothetical protein
MLAVWQSSNSRLHITNQTCWRSPTLRLNNRLSTSELVIGLTPSSKHWSFLFVYIFTVLFQTNTITKNCTTTNNLFNTVPSLSHDVVCLSETIFNRRHAKGLVYLTFLLKWVYDQVYSPITTPFTRHLLITFSYVLLYLPQTDPNGAHLRASRSLEHGGR